MVKSHTQFKNNTLPIQFRPIFRLNDPFGTEADFWLF